MSMSFTFITVLLAIYDTGVGGGGLRMVCGKGLERGRG